jgi:PAS domain S-box-containing protein
MKTRGAAHSIEFLAEVIDLVGHPIFVKDRSFRYVLVNAASCELIGLAPDQVLGRTHYDLFAAEQADAFRRKDEEAFAGAQRVIDEVTTTFGGVPRHLLATKTGLRAPSGEVTHVVGVAHDITHLKKTEDALRDANEELERRIAERTRALETAQSDLVRKERLAVLGRLAGGVAHQIRNPLGAIKNAAYVLQRAVGTSAGEHAVRALDVIHDEIERANRIITDLLDYARVRAPDRRPTRVGYILELALAAEDVPGSIRVRRSVSENERVLVDPAQVQSALSNVLRNAIEAMPHGGDLDVSARRDGAVVRVLVKDTGGGIAQEVRERLFEPLMTTKPLGLGLGLVTARTLIQGQGGRIECRETSTLGTAFEVVLPASE